MDRQALEERVIFEKFARISGYIFDRKTIKKLEPPNPDICCELEDGQKLYFELVECVDNSIAKSTYDAVEFNQRCRQALEALPGKQNVFNSKYRNALIYIYFEHGISRSKRLSTITEILEYLLNLSGELHGDITLDENHKLKKVIKRIVIARGQLNGPSFDCDCFGVYWEDSLFEGIKNKFSKVYQAKGPIELLVYFNLQPEVSGDVLSRFTDYVKFNISKSAFRRVWIYSVTLDKVSACLP